MERPFLYFDLGSPYAYLAVERAGRVLGIAPELRPVLLGAIFKWRGWGSWAQTEERDERVADIERRAASYGLPPLVWPVAWPMNGLTAMRATTWAAREGAIGPFARAVFRHQFAAGEDVSGLDALAAIGEEVGLDPAALRAAVARDDVKDELRSATEAAWEAGVRGIPTLASRGRLFYGDDRLECAAA